MKQQQYPIGIDLGTTYSCIGVYKNGQVDIIANDQGTRTMASVVSFTETERLIGDAAKNILSSNAENTIFDVKRLMGKLYNDPTIQQDIKHWPFKVTCNEDTNKPQIYIPNTNKSYVAEEVSAMILAKLKESAEAYLDQQITDVVITVPAYFNDAQRRATIDAGTIAGLNVLRIINEPTAAALAYGLHINKEEHMILVFDYGGGTLDVSLLRIYDGLFEVKATSGNTHLGGEDIDNILTTHCLKEFKQKNNQINIQELVTNKKTLGRLKIACEKAKKILSSANVTTIDIDSLFQGIDFRCNITRAKFETLCEDEFQKCMLPVKQVLSDANVDKSSITDVVLIGGSTRIPKIREMLKTYFNKEPKKDINPDEAVAYGATLQAAILSNAYEEMNQLILVDITPLSLGIETAGGIMTKIINRNDPIPCNKKQVFSTYSDNQPCVTVKIYEGEREFTKYNNLLGTFELTDIPPMLRGTPKISVKFDIDTNGILSVTATEESTLKTKNLIIKNDKNRLSSEQLAAMIEDAKKYEEQDRILKNNIQSKTDIETYIYGTKSLISSEEFKQKLDETLYEKLVSIINEHIVWIDNNQELTSEEYKLKQSELQKLISNFIIATKSN